MLLLAHRGFWTHPAEKNTAVAFDRAFKRGYGVETDVRDLDGTLVIAHDLPRLGACMTFQAFLDKFQAAGCPGHLAINIKADGLQAPLTAQLAERRIRNAFVFDMAVPDALGYIARGVDTFTRHSEIEPVPAFYDRAQGVWMDCFDQDWIDADAVGHHRAIGKRVALVSPELHRRPHREAWARWRELAPDDGVLLCTDYPDEAADFFK